MGTYETRKLIKGMGRFNGHQTMLRFTRPFRFTENLPDKSDRIALTGPIEHPQVSLIKWYVLNRKARKTLPCALMKLCYGKPFGGILLCGEMNEISHLLS